MNEIEIKQKLDQLAELQSQIDAAKLEKQALIDSVMTPEIKQQLADIEAEFENKTIGAVLGQTALETEIKIAVKELGASVKGTFLHAVFMKGRVSWDSKMLDGMVALVPQLEKARKEGEPSVSLRAAK